VAHLTAFLDTVRRAQLQRPTISRPSSRHAPVDQSSRLFWT